nr:unnamed protein product [Spirometra erinaceieuropaei]
MLFDSKGSLELTGEALTVFARIKNSLADATLLTHPTPEAQLFLMVDASSVALKTALRAVEDPGNWLDIRLLALLDIRAALKSDLGCSAAEFVFATTIRLPDEMVTPNSRAADEIPDNLVPRLRQLMCSLSLELQ